MSQIVKKNAQQGLKLTLNLGVSTYIHNSKHENWPHSAYNHKSLYLDQLPRELCNPYITSYRPVDINREARDRPTQRPKEEWINKARHTEAPSQHNCPKATGPKMPCKQKGGPWHVSPGPVFPLISSGPKGQHVSIVPRGSSSSSWCMTRDGQKYRIRFSKNPTSIYRQEQEGFGMEAQLQTFCFPHPPLHPTLTPCPTTFPFSRNPL